MKCILCIILIESPGWKSNDNVLHGWKVFKQERNLCLVCKCGQVALAQTAQTAPPTSLSALVACLHFNCGSHAIVNRLVMTRHLVNDAEDVQATERTALLRIYNLIRQGAY